jgi:uncharacterized membrane protein
MATLQRWIASAVLLVAIDAVYLFMIKDYFLRQIQLVQGGKSGANFRIGAAILCYIFLVAGLNYFVLERKSGKGQVMDAFLLGIVIYGVYETTSYALLDKWSFLTVLMDTLWGGCLFALTTAIIRAIPL